MDLRITGLDELRQRIEGGRLQEAMTRALAEQCDQLAAAVREVLSEPAGSGEHGSPWVRTGALRDSIAASVDGLEAVVGSNDPAAAPQEMGTSKMAPRPFLAPLAAGMGEAIARAVGDAVASALRADQGAETRRSGVE